MASPVVVFILALLWSCWWCDVAFVAADTTAATETFARVQNVMNDAMWLLHTFEELEISVNRPRIDATSYEVYLSPLQRQQLQQRNIAFEELLHPAAVSEEYRKRNVKDPQYTSHVGLEQLFKDLEKSNSDLLRLFSIGESVKQRQMYGVRMNARLSECPSSAIYPSSEVETCAQFGLPEVKYVANMHGDESVGREILIMFVRYLIEQYRAQNDTIRRLLTSTDLYIIPSMNPDGYEAEPRASRGNANFKDLNRNFPDLRFPTKQQTNRETETLAMMEFSRRHRFVLSSNFHGGALVANYPYDGSARSYSNVIEATPDDDMFRFLAQTYARAHKTMHRSAEFVNGITNGAQWYSLFGGMQDWNYLAGQDPSSPYRGVSTMELTLEVSDVKYPPGSQIAGFFDENLDALIAFAEMSTVGVWGRVLDAKTGKALDAMVSVVGNDHVVYSNPVSGAYFRLLMPGTYTIKVECQGFETMQQTVQVVVPRPYTARLLDFQLKSLSVNGS